MGWSRVLGLAALLPSLVYSFASTDSIQDVDPAQSGYMSNHNMDPNVITGGTFGISWQNTYNTNEYFFAKPLVYTPSGYANELVITVSNQNIIRIVDGLNGTLLFSRTLDPPFLATDASCGDIPVTIGIIGTPIIDPATSIMYFFSKGYKGGATGPQGTLNGQFKFYAVQIPTLQDVSGFPVIIDGNFASNDPTRYFVGGVVLQRTALASVGNVVIGGFAGHCDNFNYTGMLVAVSKTSGVGVTNVYAMEASPGAPSPQPLLYTTQQGGKAGIWHSGMGMAVDGNQIYFVTGNGQGAANGNVPASGRLPLSTLEQVVANFAVNPSTGTFSQTDYFEPYEYQSLDGGDKDFGSSGACLLDPTTFSGTGVERMVVAGGKSGKIYVLNAGDLGGFAQGPGGSDNVIQTIVNSGSIFGGVGSYPLEGGYFYYNPTGGKLFAYKMGLDGSGRPLFTLAGQSASTFAGKGAPTVTSLNGNAGTGIVWIADVNVGLVAFNAVPVNGVLQQITVAATGGLTKFQRPAFGNGRVYVTTQNKIIALGTPVVLPLLCTNPVNFGSLSAGQTLTVQVTCTAQTAGRINGCTTSLATFQCQNSSLPSTVAAGASFSFPVTWNLTPAAISQAQSMSLLQVQPGNSGAALNIYATAGVSGYVTNTPVQLSGTIVASQGYLVINLLQVDFGGIFLGGSVSQVSKSVVLSNQGTGVLTFSGFAWQDMNVAGLPYNNVTVQSNQAVIVGNGFTATSFPTVGSQIFPGQSITIPLSFSASTVGTWASTLWFWSDGGSTDVLMTGTAASTPIASISISDGQGNWISNSLNMAFGNVSPGAAVERQIRICNVGASALTITSSQPPSGADLTALDSNLDLLLGSIISVGACSYGNVIVIAPPLQPNSPSISLSGQWVIGTNGNNPDGSAFGSKTVTITAAVAPRQVGPLEPNGQGIYQLLGCFSDTNGRNLATSTSFSNNSIEACMTYCYGAGYAYAGTEYQTQCWCGNTLKFPSTFSPQGDCNFACPGDATEICGGNAGGGGFLFAYYNQNSVNPVTVLPSVFGSTTTTTTSSTTTTSTTTKSSSSFSLTSTVTSSSTSSPAGSSTSSLTSTSSSSFTSSTSLLTTTSSSSLTSTSTSTSSSSLTSTVSSSTGSSVISSSTGSSVSSSTGSSSTGSSTSSSSSSTSSGSLAASSSSILTSSTSSSISSSSIDTSTPTSLTSSSLTSSSTLASSSTSSPSTSISASSTSSSTTDTSIPTSTSLSSTDTSTPTSSTSLSSTSSTSTPSTSSSATGTSASSTSTSSASSSTIDTSTPTSTSSSSTSSTLISSTGSSTTDTSTPTSSTSTTSTSTSPTSTSASTSTSSTLTTSTSTTSTSATSTSSASTSSASTSSASTSTTLTTSTSLTATDTSTPTSLTSSSISSSTSSTSISSSTSSTMTDTSALTTTLTSLSSTSSTTSTTTPSSASSSLTDTSTTTTSLTSVSTTSSITSSLTSSSPTLISSTSTSLTSSSTTSLSTTSSSSLSTLISSSLTSSSTSLATSSPTSSSTSSSTSSLTISLSTTSTTSSSTTLSTSLSTSSSTFSSTSSLTTSSTTSLTTSAISSATSSTTLSTSLLTSSSTSSVSSTISSSTSSSSTSLSISSSTTSLSTTLSSSTSLSTTSSSTTTSSATSSSTTPSSTTSSLTISSSTTSLSITSSPTTLSTTSSSTSSLTSSSSSSLSMSSSITSLTQSVSSTSSSSTSSSLSTSSSSLSSSLSTTSSSSSSTLSSSSSLSTSISSSSTSSSSTSRSTTSSTSSFTSSSSSSTSSLSSSSSSISSSVSSTTSSSATPSISLNPNEPATIGTFSYIGCYYDLVNNVRTFSYANFAYDPMTLESCAQNCNGYNYFGTEFGRECFCGYTLSPTLKAPESNCNTQCSGSTTEICGSGARLSVYHNSIVNSPPAHVASAGGYQWLSCYTEATNGRALTGPSFASNTMTVESCVAFCSGYAYAGVEYSRECYCGNSLSAGSVPAATTDCNMLCAGSASEYCGGGGRLDMYHFGGVSSSTTSTTVLPTTSTTSTTPNTSTALTTLPTSSTMTTTPTTLPTTSATSTTPLTTLATSSTSTSPTTSTTATTPTTLPTTSTSTKPPTTLTTSTTSTTSTTPPTTLATSSTATGPSSNPASTTSSSRTTSVSSSSATTATATSSAYQYIGCFQDTSAGHALPLLLADNTVTPEVCAAYVQALAKQPIPTVLPYFYVEYHRECYGGSSFSFGASAVTSLTGVHACTDLCSGSVGAKTTGTAFCGGPQQFNLYATNGVVNWPSPPITKSA